MEANPQPAPSTPKTNIQNSFIRPEASHLSPHSPLRRTNPAETLHTYFLSLHQKSLPKGSHRHSTALTDNVCVRNRAGRKVTSYRLAWAIGKYPVSKQNWKTIEQLKKVDPEFFLTLHFLLVLRNKNKCPCIGLKHRSAVLAGRRPRRPKLTFRMTTGSQS